MLPGTLISGANPEAERSAAIPTQTLQAQLFSMFKSSERMSPSSEDLRPLAPQPWSQNPEPKPESLRSVSKIPKVLVSRLY